MSLHLSDKLSTLADGMQSSIDNARRPMTQNPTPKRMREYNSRVLDGNNLELGQRALRALAALHGAGNGSVPPILSALKSKAEILPLVRKSISSSSYYDIHSTGEYADKSPAGIALQNLIDNPVHLSPEKQAEQAAEDADRVNEEKIKRMEDQLRFATIPGFFPTPPALALRMIEMAEIEDHHRVLEPSAGIGSIAELIKILHPDIFLDVLEVQHSLVVILGAKGFNVHRHDFLEWPAPHVDGRKGYDRIVMNPPFEKRADQKHLQKAYSVLAPGGRVVSIMSGGAFYGDSKQQDFCDWLGSLDSVREDLDGAFAGIDAFRRTGVSAKLVVIDKPSKS